RQHSGFEVATNQSQKSPVLDSASQPLHQHVVLDPVEELLQIQIHDDDAALLDIPLRRSHRIVRVSHRPKAVAVLGKGRIESRLQHLQDGLLDQPIDHGGNAQRTHSTPSLRDLPPQHRLRSVLPREQLLAQALSLPLPETPQLLPGHPIDSSTTLVLLHSTQRRLQVATLDHLLQQVAGSRATVSVCRQSRFTTPLSSRGFTPNQKRELQLPGHLVPCASKTHGRFALPTVRPFAPSRRLL